MNTYPENDILYTFRLDNFKTGSEITHKFNLDGYENLENVIDHFVDFLLGVGYSAESIADELGKNVMWLGHKNGETSI